jgi:hypothetical protein
MTGVMFRNNANVLLFIVLLFPIVIRITIPRPFPSPDWTLACLYRVGLDQEALGKSGTASEGLRHQRARPLPGTAFAGYSPGNAHTPRLVPSMLALLFLELCPTVFLSCAHPHQGFGNPFSVSPHGFDRDWLDLYRCPQALVPSALPDYGLLPSVALVPWPCPNCFKHPSVCTISGWII